MKWLLCGFLVACSTGQKTYIGDEGTIEDSIIDGDADGFLSNEDCDDTNPAVNPNQNEICDGLDNNCDGYIDENLIFV